jgi:hypothetical protein
MGGSPADILNKLRKPQVVKEFTNARSASTSASSSSLSQQASSQEAARIRTKASPTSTMEAARPPIHPTTLDRIFPASPLLFSGLCPDTDTEDEDHGSVGLPIDEPRSSRKLMGHKKSVSFSSLEIREYEVVIGDHPCCTRGVPLSLGWEYSEAGFLNLDDYEEGRSPRRSRVDLRTSSEERCEILSDVATQHDLRRAQRKMHRVRSCSAKLCERVNAKFFDGSEPPLPSSC